MFDRWGMWDGQQIWLTILGLSLCVFGVVAARVTFRNVWLNEGWAQTNWIVATSLASAGVGASAVAVVALTMTPAAEAGRVAAVALGASAMLGMVAVAAIAVRLGKPPGRRRDHSLVERKMMLEAVLHDDPHGFCLFGAEGRLEFCNEAFLDIYAFPPGQPITGSTFGRLLSVLNAGGVFPRLPEQIADMKAALASGGPAQFTVELRDGRHIKVALKPLPDGGWISKHEDVTDQTQAEARFAYLALHDVATGLPNRAAFNHRIGQSVDAARQLNASFAVIRLGIDRFKEINDVFGQAVGDAVLAAMARRLAETCYWGYLARPGGDEFSIVTPPDQATDALQEICHQLSRLCDVEFDIDGQVIRVSSTAGVSVYPRDGEKAETLIAHADVALYRAKTEKRGTVCLFEPAMDLQIRNRRALQRELAAALPNGEFEIHYQPQAITTGEIVGFEALLRWRHPVRGMVSPAEFIPLAEETGLIGAIDEWVLRSACSEAASWPNPLAIAINLSPLDFRRLDVPALILSVLHETGLQPKRLEVEITEGVLIDDFAGAIAILRRIKNLGVRIAMDDFGAGYSSLSYLQSFPFDKIKIDQAFTKKLETNRDTAAIVEAILSLARTLGLRVIAEGVETPDQLAFLARTGCDEVQGYLLGRPAPIEQYREVVKGTAGSIDMLAQAS